MTQYGRALHELGIEIICANTAAAKGRALKGRTERSRIAW
jgi:hypothetical protein